MWLTFFIVGAEKSTIVSVSKSWFEDVLLEWEVCPIALMGHCGLFLLSLLKQRGMLI